MNQGIDKADTKNDHEIILLHSGILRQSLKCIQMALKFRGKKLVS